MDKYEFNLKVEQIRKLAGKKQFKEASKIAKDMNWTKVKDWATLATIINVHEAVGDYEEARDMAILAYNRNLGGRKLIYKLTEFLISLQDFENADQLFEEYEKASQHDVNRFILYYDLRKAEKASNNELIEILEDYKEHEIDEKYMYELGELYYKTNRREECIKICDDIVLWFQDGTYVEKAVKLKKDLNVDLTNTQKKIFDNIQNQKEDGEAIKEIKFKEQKELTRIQHDDVEEELYKDSIKNGEVAEPDEDEVEFDDMASRKEQIFSPLKATESETIKADVDEPDNGLSIDLIQNQQDSLIKDNFKNAVSNLADTEEIVEVTQAGAEAAKVGVDKAALSLKELIANAKKKLENNYDQLNRESEEEKRYALEKQINDKAYAMDIEVSVPDYNNMYNTQNIQAELAKNMSELFGQEEALRPHPVIAESAEPEVKKDKPSEQSQIEENLEDEQIQGQLSLADWIETVREEKYGKQNTKEFSKAELDRMLDEKDEKSAAFDKLMAEQKAKAAAKGERFNEAAARYNAQIQLMINSVRTDLAIRTGKATVRLEEAAAHIIEDPVSADKQSQQSNNEVSQSAEELPKSEVNDNITLVTAQIPEISDAILSSVKEIMNEEVNDNIEGSIENDTDMEDVDIKTESRKFKINETEKAPMSKVDELDTSEDEDKRLPEELAKLFRKYREMPGLESQLVDYFNSISDEMNMSTSKTGNILISGNSSSDKVDLARTIVRALNHIYPDKPKKIAKTTGDSINHRGISKAMGKLKGTVLIVEDAGSIQPKRIAEILNCLEQETERMIIIFEDSDAEMNVLLNFNPELVSAFNHRIILKQYTVNELVEMARKFARKRQYEVDDDALLQLYLKIDKLHNNSDNIKLDDIKEIINQAILRSEKRASKKFFGGLKKKHGEKGDVIFLSEADFKD